MPAKYTPYEPDQKDCLNCVKALGADFGVIASLETIYTLEHVVTIARCRPIADAHHDATIVQALVRVPIQHARQLYAMQYSALLDCWHQLDRGVLLAAERGAVDRGISRPPSARRAR